MKVLWFSVTPSKPDKNGGENGLGWIGALLRVISNCNQVELGIAYKNQKEHTLTDESINGIKYYSIGYRIPFYKALFKDINPKYEDEILLGECLKVINDFNPDIIHIFGSEWCYGLLSERTSVPVVIHMQGSWIAYLHTTFPSGVKYYQTIVTRWYDIKLWIRYFKNVRYNKNIIEREKKVLKCTTNFMGRTHWDYMLCKLFSPNSNYYFCNEALRDSFINTSIRWSLKKRKNKVFTTVSSSAGIKGYDVILRTAQLIRENYPTLDFQWRLIGINSYQLSKYEKFVGIKAKEVNIVALGNKTATEMITELIDSDIFVHCSYMDNSPNSICEAQYLGMPIVCTAPGGVRDLFSDDYNKYCLLPIDDPFYLAYEITNTIFDDNKMKEMSDKNFNKARERHNDSFIQEQLLSTYTAIIKAN